MGSAPMRRAKGVGCVRWWWKAETLAFSTAAAHSSLNAPRFGTCILEFTLMNEGVAFFCLQVGDRS